MDNLVVVLSFCFAFNLKHKYITSAYPHETKIIHMQSKTQDKNVAGTAVASNVIYTESSQYPDGHCELPALNSLGAWCALENNVGSHFLTMDLGIVYSVLGVITQGRADQPQWVTAYQVYYSTDNSSWTSGGTFKANSDESTEVTNNVGFYARFVKVLPTASSGWVALRANVVGQPGERY